MSFLSSLFGNRAPRSQPSVVDQAAPLEIVTASASTSFDMNQHLWDYEGLPIPNWEEAERWLATVADTSERAIAKTDCQRAWLLHFRDALGEPYQVHESEAGLLLSPYSLREAVGTLEFVARTRKRIEVALEGLAKHEQAAKEVLIVFSDPDAYYAYVSHAYPQSGEFSFSSGMYLHAHCPHFVTTREEMSSVERVIAHELTHASLAHLRIPLWLNEGIAVNTEDRLMGRLPKLFTPQEFRRKHLAYWSEVTIQEFWSGRSFHDSEGSLLAYDLAQILVEVLASPWAPFRAFATAADYSDAGAAAAREHLGIDLGEAVAAIFEPTSSADWYPNPEKWQNEIEHAPE